MLDRPLQVVRPLAQTIQAQAIPNRHLQRRPHTWSLVAGEQSQCLPVQLDAAMHITRSAGLGTKTVIHSFVQVAEFPHNGSEFGQ